MVLVAGHNPVEAFALRYVLAASTLGMRILYVRPKWTVLRETAYSSSPRTPVF